MSAPDNKRRFQTPGQKPADRLPPHSIEAEQGVLGCVLLSEECLKECEEWFRGLTAFYDLRHQTIYRAMVELHREGKAIDLVTLQQWLKGHSLLEESGGAPYLCTLPETVPSAANLRYYLEIVWEKFLARRVIQEATMQTSAIFECDGVNEHIIAHMERFYEEFKKIQTRGEITPQYLKSPADFQEGFYQQFFGGSSEAPGLELPIAFPLKIRRRETTLVSGDDGSGKSTLLDYIALHLAAQGEKVLIASLEMPPEVTLWILASQLLGTKRLQDCAADQEKAGLALLWLAGKFLFYDFTGIAEWRDLQDTFAYASAKSGMTCVVMDSWMRIGIPDDDYAQQGLAAARFAQGAKDGGYHLFEVIHENKGDGKGKSKVRGSKLLTANVDNVLEVKINAAKGEKADKLAWEIENERVQTSPDTAVIAKKEGELAKMRQQWDTNLVLRKQRWPGTRQNASKFFWFDRECFQFRGKWDEPSTNWLSLWGKKKKG